MEQSEGGAPSSGGPGLGDAPAPPAAGGAGRPSSRPPWQEPPAVPRAGRRRSPCPMPSTLVPSVRRVHVGRSRCGGRSPRSTAADRPTEDRPAPSPAEAPGWTVGCRWSLVAALVGALIGGGIVAPAGHGGGSTTVKEISAGPALLNGTTNIESVIAKVLPAVVSIDATSPEPASQSIFGGGYRRRAGGPGHRDDHHPERRGGHQQPRDRRGHHHHRDPVRQPQGAAGHPDRHRPDQ